MAFSGGIVFETGTGYTYAAGTGAFADGDSRFSGENLQAEINTGTDNKDFTGGTLGNWTVFTNGGDLSTLLYEGTDPGAEKVGELTFNDDTLATYVYGALSTASWTPVANSLHKATVNVYCPSGNPSTSNTASFVVSNFAGSVGVTKELEDDTWTEMSFYFTTDDDVSGFLRIGLPEAFSPVTGDMLYFDDVSVVTVVSLATQNFDGYLLELIDASNRRAYGFIGPAETGKVLDTPVIDDDCADDEVGDWMQIDSALTHDTDHYVLTVSGDGPTEDTCYALNMNVMTAGVRYKISFRYYIPAGNTNVDTLSIRTYYDYIWKVPGLDTLNVTNAWTYAEAEITCHDVLRDMLIFYMQDGESSDGLTLNDEIWLKDILVEPVAMEDPQAVTIYKQRDPINEGWRRIGNGFEFNDATYTFNVYRLPGVQGQQW